MIVCTDPSAADVQRVGYLMSCGSQGTTATTGTTPETKSEGSGKATMQDNFLKTFDGTVVDMTSLSEVKLIDVTNTLANGTTQPVFSVNAGFKTSDSTSKGREIADVSVKSGDITASVIQRPDGSLAVLVSVGQPGGPSTKQFVVTHPINQDSLGDLNIKWTSNSSVDITHSSGPTQTVSLVNGKLSLDVNLPQGYQNDVNGAFGDNDGNTANDFDCKQTQPDGSVAKIADEYCKANLMTPEKVAEVCVVQFEFISVYKKLVFK